MARDRIPLESRRAPSANQGNTQQTSSRVGKAGRAVPGGVGSVDVKGRERTGATGAVPTTAESFGQPPPTSGPSRLTGPLQAGVAVAVVVCLVASLIHVCMVFLHVAPPNPVSQQLRQQVNAWVYPLFEQNWKLFAPEPESVNRRISARTAHTGRDGTVRVSGWFDLSAADDSAVRHNVLPSHTTQNMLRRAWSSYSELFGTDDVPHTDRALMILKYLRNIAADRVAAHRGGTFESIQLRVVTQPIATSAAAGGGRAKATTTPTPANTRLLPWWKVTPDGN